MRSARRIKVRELAGDEASRDERANAVGALCNMMAIKTTNWREEEEGAAAAAEEGARAGVGRDDAPREMPSAIEWATNPTTVEKDEPSALIM